MNKSLWIGAFLVMAFVSSGCGAAEPVSLSTLLDEMTDLSSMAEFPSPAYTCRQFSSYDRGAISPKKNWFANADCGHYLRVEKHEGRNEHVMMDADGPGAIVRIWSANPRGALRFYLDGSDIPAWTVPMADLLVGKYKPIPKPLSGMRGRGCNLYFPIPYAKHCKVTSDLGGFYYHVNYRTYTAGTKVVSFAESQLQADAKKIAAVAAKLASPRTALAKPVGLKTMPIKAELPAGGSAVLAELRGSKAIRRLALQIKAKDITEALGRVLLTITFDGQKTVCVPLGDFFGSAPGINPYASLPCGMTKDGQLWCHWKMPFAKSAKLTVRNYTGQAVSISGHLGATLYPWGKRSLLFHAKWRNAIDIHTRPFKDWNFLTAKGRGVFAGVSYQICNPVSAWWGEGDEKIYFDGQTFPSHFGTGTEDYFGYAWGCPDKFSHAYHNQTRCDGPGTRGHNSLNRWHIMDRIPFERDFRFDMELWHWVSCHVNLGVTAYWYARPGATDTFPPVTDKLIRSKWPKIKIVAGAIEAETMRIISKTGHASPQESTQCSRFQQLWWRGGKIGDKLVLGFKAPKAGRFLVKARLGMSHDYGICQLYINGVKAGERFNLYSKPYRVQDVDLGVCNIKKGENTITVEIVGADKRAGKGRMFSMDCIVLAPPK